jgi:hypothetical protein
MLIFHFLQKKGRKELWGMDYIAKRRKRRNSGAVIELLGLCHLALDIMGGGGKVQDILAPVWETAWCLP